MRALIFQKQLLLRWLSLLLVSVTFPSCSTPHDSSTARMSTVPLGLEAWVASEAARLGAREFPVTRLSTEGDLDGDHRLDPVWIYRLDGGRGPESFQQFLAVQLSGDPRRIHSLAVGNDGGRSISEVRVVSGTVELNAQEYLPADPACCPSGHATLRLELRSGRLVFLNP